MRRLMLFLAVSLALASLICSTAQAQGIYENLYEFAGGADDGAYPYDSLTLNGSTTLYGMTRMGGAYYSRGVIFTYRLSGPSYPGYAPENVFDGDYSTFWAGGQGVTEWNLYYNLVVSFINKVTYYWRWRFFPFVSLKGQNDSKANVTLDTFTSFSVNHVVSEANLSVKSPISNPLKYVTELMKRTT